MFGSNLMFTFRNWLHYQHNSNLRLSVSPFAYFSDFRIIQDNLDKTAIPNKEIRVSVVEELQHEISKYLYFINRNDLEYRIFNNAQSNITRFRTRLGYRYEFTDRLKLTVFDELFLNMVGTVTESFFDHNRTALNMEYSILPNLKFDAGYVYLTRFSVSSPARSTVSLYENNMFLNLTYQLKIRKVDWQAIRFIFQWNLQIYRYCLLLLTLHWFLPYPAPFPYPTAFSRNSQKR